jgi:flagellar protein FliS
MMQRARQTYLTEKILSADPLELVRLLYGGAIESVERARAGLAGGDIAGRARAVSKAVEIMSQLAWSLDHGSAPELSGKLAALYDYMQRRLLEGNFRQRDEPLAEVLGLLRTLAAAWQSVTLVSAPAKAATAWTPAVSCGGPELAVQGWSF